MNAKQIQDITEKKRSKKRPPEESAEGTEPHSLLLENIKRIGLALGSFVLGLLLIFASFGLGGDVGSFIIHKVLLPFVGYGYIVLILALFVISIMLTRNTLQYITRRGWALFGVTFVVFLWFVDILFFFSPISPTGFLGGFASASSEWFHIYVSSAMFVSGMFMLIVLCIAYWDLRLIFPDHIARKLSEKYLGHPEGFLKYLDVLLAARNERDLEGERAYYGGMLPEEFDALAGAKKDKERWDYFTQKVDAFFEAAFADEDIDELDFQKLRMEVDGWYPDDQDLRKNLIRSMDKRFDQFYDTIAIEKDRKMQIENSQIEMLRGEVPQPKDDEIVVEERTLPTTYVPPPLSLLSKSKGKALVGDTKANANLIKRTLQNFGIDVEMDEVSVGPTVTRYALKPAEGVKLSRIVGLQNDLALALAAHPLRIEAPIPGKALVGVEIPNRSKATVGLGSLIEEPEFAQSPKPLLVCLGKGVTGKSYYTDIAKMPHMLIAGTTGSGKSVTVHNLIISLLYRNGPQDLRFIMVDPKRVELTLYNKIPHLLTPVIKQPKKAILALKWAVKEMERRYDVLESEQVRDINSYHSTIVEPAYTKAKNGEMDENDLPERMPYIVIFIDELSDLMQAYPRELEAAIVRLAQMSRAVGIHLVLSTQRPSVNVITGLIKANVPARIALQVSSQIDSRTILDVGGAEKLLGAGDMLFSGGETNKPVRMQSAFITEDEVKKVVDHLIRYQSDDLVDEISLSENEGHADSNIFTMSMSDGDEGDDDDDLYEDAKKVVLEAGKASTSYLQRKLKVGYSRAARLIDLLEDRGVVGPANGSKPRDVIDGGADTSSSNDGGYLDDQEEPDTDETYDSDDYEDDDEEHEDA